ncbi:hypothetical protein Hanom_Chr02g00161071 [Helianthus anomalus]
MLGKETETKTDYKTLKLYQFDHSNACIFALCLIQRKLVVLISAHSLEMSAL